LVRIMSAMVRPFGEERGGDGERRSQCLNILVGDMVTSISRPRCTSSTRSIYVSRPVPSLIFAALMCTAMIGAARRKREVRGNESA